MVIYINFKYFGSVVMKRALSVLIVLFILSSASIANAGLKGTVVFARNDVAVIQTEQLGNYTILTSCYGVLAKNDKVFGEFNSFGSYDFYNITKDGTFNGWVDSYWQSEQQVVDWVKFRFDI